MLSARSQISCLVSRKRVSVRLSVKPGANALLLMMSSEVYLRTVP